MFLTIAKNADYTAIIKKSRFIGQVFRINNEEQAQQIIEQVQTANRKANHNCFAYMVGDDDKIQRESDNGEPSGTAGVPILKSLQMMHLHNVLAVVTRYFGGIKLGAGGLIRAYSNTTTNALEAAGIVQRIQQATMVITVPYAKHDAVSYYLKEHEITIANEDYGVAVKMSCYVNSDHYDELQNDLTNRFANQLQFKKGAPRFHEVPYQSAK